MNKICELAERLFLEDIDYVPMPYHPYHTPPRLSNLWPCDQKRYLRMAEAALSGSTDQKGASDEL